jgi:hypothetical protein
MLEMSGLVDLNAIVRNLRAGNEIEYEPLEYLIETTESYFQLHDMDLFYQQIGYFEEVVVAHMKTDFDALVPDEMKRVASRMPRLDVDVLGEIFLRENMR